MAHLKNPLLLMGLSSKLIYGLVPSIAEAFISLWWISGEGNNVILLTLFLSNDIDGGGP